MSSTGLRELPAVVFLLLFLSPLPASGDTNPHFGPIICTSCHVDEEDYELKSENYTELCNACHEDHPPGLAHHPLRMVTDAVQVPEDWPVEEGSLTCLTCHLPSHDENIDKYNFLRVYDVSRPQDFCSRCHRLWEKRDPHAATNEEKGCETCHRGSPKPGEDTLKSVGFYGTPTVLCLRCHEVPPHPGGYDHTSPIAPALAENFSEKFPLFEDDRISCSTCHNPHVIDGNFKLRKIAIESLACPGCHNLESSSRAGR